MKNELIELRKQAEQAVQDMKDGDLKVKAFETILAHLLAGNSAEPSPASPGKPAPQRKQAETSLAKPPKSAVERILSLKVDGFFASQRSIAEIRQELKKNGWHYPVTSLSGPLQTLVTKRVLRRENVKGWKYSNA
ncbi:MAG: hypothetical protein WBD87_11250 [Candidatus Acidiferrales bacterium]